MTLSAIVEFNSNLNNLVIKKKRFNCSALVFYWDESIIKNLALLPVMLFVQRH